MFRRGEEIYVAGKLYGNIFVMIQPPRGFGENPLAVYHSGDLIPTHHYLGAYHWLRDVFRADALVQCGKHGTLEWLPGKGIGLSESCYPELAIGDLPVFYPFIINDPGEGAQAKRRMHACIIDHLIPPMTQSETYDELARLQQLLGTYANAERIDPEKLPLIQQDIWNAVVAANLHQDLGVDAQPDDEAYGEFIQHIDGYLCEIGDLQIRDGLHVLGQMPEGEQLINLALALIRLDSPGFTGIRRAIAEDYRSGLWRAERSGRPWLCVSGRIASVSGAGSGRRSGAHEWRFAAPSGKVSRDYSSRVCRKAEFAQDDIGAALGSLPSAFEWKSERNAALVDRQDHSRFTPHG